MKPILKSAVALMVVMTITGCDRVQKAARDLTGDADGNGHPPASAKPAAAHASSSVSASAGSSSSGSSSSVVAAIIDPPETQVGDWHIAMTAACAAGKAEHMAHFDINGDGIPDTVCWRVVRSKTYGSFAEVDARVKTGDKEQSAYILLPANGNQQVALCSVDHLTVKQELWAQKDIAQMGWDADHRISLTVDDSACDPVWLFWPKDAAGDEVDFRFERN